MLLTLTVNPSSFPLPTQPPAHPAGPEEHATRPPRPSPLRLPSDWPPPRALLPRPRRRSGDREEEGGSAGGGPPMEWASAAYTAAALVCAAAATVVALVHIYRHLLHYAEPIYQRFIVRMIFMVPVRLRAYT